MNYPEPSREVRPSRDRDVDGPMGMKTVSVQTLSGITLDGARSVVARLETLLSRLEGASCANAPEQPKDIGLIAQNLKDTQRHLDNAHKLLSHLESHLFA